MGEKFHSAYRCDPTLLRELGEVATAAVVERDETRVEAWWHEHRERYRLHDAVSEPLDLEALGPLRRRFQVCRARYPERVERIDAALAGQRERQVSRTAQHRLRLELDGLASHPRMRARPLANEPAEVVEMIAHYFEQRLATVEHAIAALDGHDLHSRLGLDHPPGLPFEAAVQLCAAPGWLENIGVADAGGGPSLIDGSGLVGHRPVPKEIDPVLVQRVVEVEGVFSDELAGELLHRDWCEVVGHLDYVAPTWGTGDVLLQAASSVDELVSELAHELEQALDGADDESGLRPLHDEHVAALRRYQAHLRAAAIAGDAVVEWVRKF